MTLKHQHIVDRLNAKMREHDDIPWWIWVCFWIIAGLVVVKW